MTKNLNKICKFIICLISILFISACSSQEKNEKSSNKKDSYQYTIYNANADIQNVEFIHDKNGIIVEWDFENNKVAKAINSSDWIRVNPNFLVSDRQNFSRAPAG